MNVKETEKIHSSFVIPLGMTDVQAYPNYRGDELLNC